MERRKGGAKQSNFGGRGRMVLRHLLVVALSGVSVARNENEAEGASIRDLAEEAFQLAVGFPAWPPLNTPESRCSLIILSHFPERVSFLNETLKLYSSRLGDTLSSIAVVYNGEPPTPFYYVGAGAGGGDVPVEVSADCQVSQ